MDLSAELAVYFVHTVTPVSAAARACAVGNVNVNVNVNRRFI